MSDSRQSSVRSLPDSPSFQSLKNQAKQLHQAVRSGDADAIARVRASHPDWSRASDDDVKAASLSLVDAQLVIAREYGFDSWPKLKHFVESGSTAPEWTGLSSMPDRMLDDVLASLKTRHLAFAEMLKRHLVFHGLAKSLAVDVEIERSTFGDLVDALPNPCAVLTFTSRQATGDKLVGERGRVLVEYAPDLMEALGQYIGGSDGPPVMNQLHMDMVPPIHAFETVWRSRPELKGIDASWETGPTSVGWIGSDGEYELSERHEATTVVSFPIRWESGSSLVRLCYLDDVLHTVGLPRRYRVLPAVQGKSLKGADRKRAEALFEDHSRCRVEIDSVLQDRSYGRVIVDDAESPTLAMVTRFDEGDPRGPVTWFGGDPTHPDLGDWVKSRPLAVVPENAEWEQALTSAAGDPDGRHEYLELSPDALDADALAQLADQRTDDTRIEPMTLDNARELAAGFWPGFASGFASLKDFVDRGVGVCGWIEDRLVLAAVTTVVSESAARIEFREHPDFEHERLTLGQAVCAALARDCLNRGLTPGWQFHRPPVYGVHQLGLRLGYTYLEGESEYQLLEWGLGKSG